MVWNDETELDLGLIFHCFTFFGILSGKHKRTKSLRIQSKTIILVTLGN